jgi:hypothetical protein
MSEIISYIAKQTGGNSIMKDGIASDPSLGEDTAVTIIVTDFDEVSEQPKPEMEFDKLVNEFKDKRNKLENAQPNAEGVRIELVDLLRKIDNIRKPNTEIRKDVYNILLSGKYKFPSDVLKLGTPILWSDKNELGQYKKFTLEELIGEIKEKGVDGLPKNDCWYIGSKEIWREITGDKKGYILHHLDNNGFNFDLDNLVYVTKKEHGLIHKFTT